MGRGRKLLLQFFELAGLFVFADVVPGEIASIHRDVDTGGKCLGESEGTAQIEETVGAAEFIGNHGAGQNDRFPGNFFGEGASGDGHRIGTMCDDDLVFVGGSALVSDQVAVLVCHVEAIDHHQRADSHVERASAAIQHFGQVCFLEKQLTCQFIVLLIESPASDEYANSNHVREFRREDM